MKVYNPNKKIRIEIHQNDMSGTNGYTVYRIVKGKRTDTLSRNADGEDFDFMTDKELNDFFENGKYKFIISASDAIKYFNYLY